MLVTTQCKLDFGPTDKPAMDRCPRMNQFKSLPNPKRKAAAWLKRHDMECVVCTAEKAKTCDDNSKDETDSKSNNDNNVRNEDLHLFASNLIENRINFNHLPNDNPREDIKDCRRHNFSLNVNEWKTYEKWIAEICSGWAAR